MRVSGPSGWRHPDSNLGHHDFQMPVAAIRHPLRTRPPLGHHPTPRVSREAVRMNRGGGARQSTSASRGLGLPPRRPQRKGVVGATVKYVTLRGAGPRRSRASGRRKPTSTAAPWPCPIGAGAATARSPSSPPASRRLGCRPGRSRRPSGSSHGRRSSRLRAAATASRRATWPRPARSARASATCLRRFCRRPAGGSQGTAGARAGAGQVLQAPNTLACSNRVFDAFTTDTRCRREVNRPPGLAAVARPAARLRPRRDRRRPR
jgi:hypothetical protein